MLIDFPQRFRLETLDPLQEGKPSAQVHLGTAERADESPLWWGLLLVPGTKKNRALACCRRYFQSHVFMINVSLLANHGSGARPRWSLPSSSGILFSMSMILRRIHPCFHGSDFFTALQACCPENVKKPCSVPWASLGEGVAWSQMGNKFESLNSTIFNCGCASRSPSVTAIPVLLRCHIRPSMTC